MLRLIRETAKSCAQKHLKTLARKRKNFTFQDEYGKENKDGWDRELEYFWRSILCEEITNVLENNGMDKAMKKNLGGEKGIKLTAIEEVNRLATFAGTQTTDQRSDDVPTNPYEYEGYCRRLLEQAGWKARRIGRSGDQGADVLAEKKNVSVVLQCKLWNQPVGNSAVQEVVAAKKLYSASAAFVVSNQPFTVPAKILAAANQVHLLHHSDLASLDSFLHDKKSERIS